MAGDKLYSYERFDSRLNQLRACFFAVAREGVITNVSFTDAEAAYCQESDTFIFYLFILSHFFIGVGNTLYWTSGIVYMDQNCSKKTFPLLFCKCKLEKTKFELRECVCPADARTHPADLVGCAALQSGRRYFKDQKSRFILKVERQNPQNGRIFNHSLPRR